VGRGKEIGDPMSLYELALGFGWGLSIGVLLSVGCFLVMLAGIYLLYFIMWIIGKSTWLTGSLFGWWFDSNSRILSGASERLQKNTHKNKVKQEREVI
jgi:hypothetical protein